MIFLFDTNAVSDLIRENGQVVNRLRNLPATDRVVTCVIVRGEVDFGIVRLPAGRRRRELEARAAQLFADISCEPMPEEVGHLYAGIKLACRQKGLPLDENDLWIAATALAFGAVLVSRDTDFQNVDGLTIEDWTI